MRAIESWWRNTWQDVWHTPVAAERLALLRISTGIALLTDICVQQLPWYPELFGAGGFQPNGYSDTLLLRSWRWTAYAFQPNEAVLVLTFALWSLLVGALVLGIRTRFVSLLVWALSLAFLNRHYHLKNFGDSALRFTLFMGLFVPWGSALSWDAWRKPRSLVHTWQTPWGVRLFQLQLCALYTSTGISKLIGPLHSTWYQGTSLHYALNDFVLARVAYALVPVPLWLTMPLTYAVLLWELGFVPLVVWRRTRAWALAFGVVFHLLTFLVFEIGWFAFYVLAWYCAWIPDEWFPRVLYPQLERWAGPTRASGAR
jgi:hypothetical protein